VGDIWWWVVVKGLYWLLGGSAGNVNFRRRKCRLQKSIAEALVECIGLGGYCEWCLLGLWSLF